MKTRVSVSTLSIAVAGLIGGIGVVFALQPREPKLWIGGLVLGFGVAVLSMSAVSSSRRTKEALGERPALSEDEIYRNFFGDSGIPKAVVLELWNEVASALSLPAGKLRPSDRFGQELGAYLITSEKLDSLASIATARAKRRGATVDLSRIDTLCQYVGEMAAFLE